jgi:hypothetical protein
LARFPATTVSPEFANEAYKALPEIKRKGFFVWNGIILVSAPLRYYAVG